MNEILEGYARLLPFLAATLGAHCEIALLDCQERKLVAIENGYISGRGIGAPVTDLAQKIINKKKWLTSDYEANYSGCTSDGRKLRSSTYFIKQDNKLYGMLCVNIDTSDFQNTIDIINRLSGLELMNDEEAERETFLDNMLDTTSQVLHEMYGENVPEHFSQEERLQVISELNDKGVFLVKGSISRTAQLLGCSEPSMYRYLSKLNHKG